MEGRINENQKKLNNLYQNFQLWRKDQSKNLLRFGLYPYLPSDSSSRAPSFVPSTLPSDNISSLPTYVPLSIQSIDKNQ